MARVLDGRLVGQQIREALQPRIEAFRRQAGRPPGLGIVLVGDDPASHIYVRNKRAAAAEAGLRVDVHDLPATASLAEVHDIVRRLNGSREHDGILVQDPLPAALGAGAARQVFDTIDPDKDVDGFHPVNAGRLVQGRRALAPCTPSGVIELLERAAIPIAGRHAVVIGRSDIVGKPMALLLLHRHATVTICHSKTTDLTAITRTADILVAAVGRAAFVTRDQVKPGAVVIDVGINRLTDERRVVELFGEESKRVTSVRERGSTLVGDVHPSVASVAGALTPVPGGVGPLTIAMLMANTVAAAEWRAGSGEVASAS